MNETATILTTLATALLISVSARAEPLPALDITSRLEWTAVGVVNAEGTKGASSCSGTLVAPDLVITAAHCTTEKDGLLSTLHFVAGQNGTRLVADSSSVDIFRYPAWAYASGSTKFRFDLAVVRLGRLIPRDKVRPVPLVPAENTLPKIGALLGYQNAPDKSLHGRFNCPLSQNSFLGVIASDCQVIGGNSGGAVLVKGAHGWQLAGVIVASKEPEGTALAVEVNDWLRGHVSEAWKREAQRLANSE
ncbi:trypsin [Sulfitobacter sp. SK012]|uniref:trypsin-like serine peptidase n=1 Tax=Sulfitobacter sp. SK012 TaxID=1389005 RepID=UPI000E0A8FC0|nr:serine protease [Sulfitobacter sp. SK012]AXI47188.1 trypsin [Sulfitobacter sp. SK012]